MSANPLQHAVTSACTATWGLIKSEHMSSSTSLACPWQLASNKASSQAGWDAPALSKISKISRRPSLTAAVVAKPLKSFWFTSAPVLCHLQKPTFLEPCKFTLRSFNVICCFLWKDSKRGHHAQTLFCHFLLKILIKDTWIRENKKCIKQLGLQLLQDVMATQTSAEKKNPDVIDKEAWNLHQAANYMH